MELELKKAVQMRQIYNYMCKLSFPYHYKVDFDTWEKAYLSDIDGDGRTLFSDLVTVGAFVDDQLIGFVQYGSTAIGFDETGEISDTVSYGVIRNLYFEETRKEAGIRLLNEAVSALSNTTDRVYAFFHYFGMSCYARHGKLFEGFGYIHSLLTQYGFAVEHENVFYSSDLDGAKRTAVQLRWHDETLGRQRYCDFVLDSDIVGGCEVHFPEQGEIAYLRWIFVNEDIRGNGIGSECMSALKTDLYHRGIVQFDTDTALCNTTAQHFYEKNHFVKEGVTRSYWIEAVTKKV